MNPYYGGAGFCRFSTGTRDSTRIPEVTGCSVDRAGKQCPKTRGSTEASLETLITRYQPSYDLSILISVQLRQKQIRTVAREW